MCDLISTFQINLMKLYICELEKDNNSDDKKRSLEGDSESNVETNDHSQAGSELQCTFLEEIERKPCNTDSAFYRSLQF